MILYRFSTAMMCNYCIAEVVDLAKSMDSTDYMSSATTTSLLLGYETLLPGNESQPLELSCDEYVAYVDKLLKV